MTVKSYSRDICQKLEFFLSVQETRTQEKISEQSRIRGKKEENLSMKRKLYIIIYREYDHRCQKAALVWPSQQKKKRS